MLKPQGHTCSMHNVTPPIRMIHPAPLHQHYTSCSLGGFSPGSPLIMPLASFGMLYSSCHTQSPGFGRAHMACRGTYTRGLFPTVQNSCCNGLENFFVQVSLN